MLLASNVPNFTIEAATSSEVGILQKISITMDGDFRPRLIRLHSDPAVASGAPAC